MDLAWEASSIVEGINDSGHFPVEESRPRQVIALAEEVGEFVGAARRFMGMARRNGSFEEMQKELADVVITAYVTAQVFDVDLDMAIHQKLNEIFSRGWKDDS